MTDKVEIANRALFKIGSEPITSFTDEVKAARVVNQTWDSLRRDELSDYPWNFAMKRAVLPALSSVPAYEFEHQYQCPSDMLQLVEIGETWVWSGNSTMMQYIENRPKLYSKEGDKILTNKAPPLKIRYTSDVENTGLWSSQFVEAFATRLAMELCIPLTESDSRREYLEGEYERIIRKAAATSAIENGPLVIADSSWVLGRL